MKRRLLLAGLLLVVLLGATAYFAFPSTIPVDVIQASVTQTEAPLAKAWSLPVAQTFRSDFTYQSNPSRCGPASLANVFRSLGKETTTEGDVLAGTGYCWTGICILGLTLDQLAEVARTKTASVEVLRDLTVDQFREEMRHSNDPDRRYVINFTRKAIFGSGVGHHSPVGGYLADDDMVFVLDVNAHFKPWLIKTDRLFAAMDTVDSDGGNKRGLLRIR